MVLAWARRSLGYEPGEAADFAEVPLQQLDAWESGTAQPALADLTKLAHAYRRPLAALLLAEPPREDAVVPDFRRHRGYKPPRMSPALHLGLRYARRQQQLARELFATLRAQPLPAAQADFPDSDALAEHERRAFDISVARQTGWGNEYAALRAWRRAVEERGVVVLQLGIPPDEVRGFSIADPAAPTIALSASESPAARIFTLMHEFGHLLVGQSGLCAPESILRSPAGSEKVEQYCNRFAGNLLVPTDAVKSHPAAHRIATMDHLPGSQDFAGLRTTFKVSSQVLWYRLHEIGLVSNRRYSNLWQVWSGNPPNMRPAGSGGGRRRAKRSIDVNGVRFTGMVVEAEEQGEISYADALDYLSIKSRDWDELASLLSEAS
jgi:Zn-dependent peptidase ImmA (M78 family)/transcriptional regulator with XRE-family HTH domain